MLAQAVIGALLWGAVANGFVEDKAGCEEGATYPHPDSCRVFSKCIGGKLVVKFCPIGEVFDQKSCIEGHSCDLSKCIDGDTRPSSSCDAYKICKSGIWVKSKCPSFHKYNHGARKCILDTESSCTFISKCAEGKKKLIGCAKYLSCEDGEEIVRGCALGEVFDEQAGTCVEGYCNHRSKRNVQTCEEGHRIRKEGECKKYLECVNGNFAEKSCSECMNFDDETRTCKLVFQNACPSPAPPVPTDPTQPSTPPSTSTTVTSSPYTSSPQPSTPTQPSPSPSPQPSPSPETSPSPQSSSTQPSSSLSPQSSSSEQSSTLSTESYHSRSTEQSSSPIPECNDGERRAIVGDCTHYYECSKGKLEKKACSFSHFDVRDLTCSYFSYKCA